jgi:DNA-directed RNA polymerase subunit E'/Rpb7
MQSPYVSSILSRRVALTIKEVGSNIKDVLARKIANEVENRCIEEGFVRPGSVALLTHSAGLLAPDNIYFMCAYAADVCMPLEGARMQCVVRTITKAGIHAQVVDEGGTAPITVFVAKEYHHSDSHFGTVREGDTITVTVVGARFEINDVCVCVIASMDGAGGGGENI